MKNRFIVLVLLTAFLNLSCQEPEPEPTPVTLASQPSQLTFEAKGGSQTLSITSGIKPTVSCSDSWISLKEGDYASNTLKVTVTAAENTGTTSRSSSIRVIGDKQSLMISVSQGIPQVELSVDKSSLSFDRFGGETTLTVTSSSHPTVSTDANW